MLGWYPGHMNKARREIQKALPAIDVVIEVVDGRLPFSSANPMLAGLIKHKPVLKILSREDLADPIATKQWQEYFDQQPDTRALPMVTSDPKSLKKIPLLCRELAGQVRSDRDIRVMVMGIPNVGKSTLINNLAGRKIAKVGNEPAVTKRQQIIRLDSGIALTDTPGVLWPKIENQASAYRLAASGAIRDTALDYVDVGSIAAAELAKRYPELLMGRYKLKSLPEYTGDETSVEVETDGPVFTDLLAAAGYDGEAIISEIARKRGGLKSGGIVDVHRGAEVLLHELRDGTLGRISLETPDDIPSLEAHEESLDAAQSLNK